MACVRVQASVDEACERFRGKLNVRGHRCGAGSERDGVGFQVDGEAALRAGGGTVMVVVAPVGLPV